MKRRLVDTGEQQLTAPFELFFTVQGGFFIINRRTPDQEGGVRS